MQIRFGYSLSYDFEQPTPMIVTLNVHYSRASDLVGPDTMITSPSTSYDSYRDGFGNWCNRVVAPAGRFQIRADSVVNGSGMADEVATQARQHPVEELPQETLIYLLPSRYCENDKLSDTAWRLFGNTPEGWERVQAISHWVHDHISFGYQWARPTKTAAEALEEGRGVCRDYAHLGIALCRAMNIPARYCTGYLGDIGVAPSADPMDFSGWFEVFLSGSWLTVDPRNLVPRVGRILIARGRDAADVAITTTFGPNVLRDFQVWADEIPAAP
ncbi:MAG: transglutaminase family protein [Actinomycetia bacterium]|nr:transglutaminase family protein [Actinomycetes bacterium]